RDVNGRLIAPMSPSDSWYLGGDMSHKSLLQGSLNRSVDSGGLWYGRCRIISGMLAGVFAFLSAVGQLVAQTQGSVRGTVVDSTGSAVPDAKVTITNIATNVAVTTSTSTPGAYSVPNLSPGVYT